jgi:sugar O-acyltransferase (sialic acid O-acetyltransferase NeuD family)
MKSLLLIGASGLAAEVIAVLDGSQEYKVIGLLDDDTSRHGTDFAGLPIYGDVATIADHPDTDIVVCTGSGRSRRVIVDRLLALGVGESRHATVIAPGVRVPTGCVVGAGSILLAGTVLTAAVTIGRHAVLMPNVVCTHDDRLGDFVTVCAGTTLGGAVAVGDEAYLGMNSSVRQNLRIGTNAVLGMGAVLLSDLPAEEVWAGNPARKITNKGSRHDDRAT